MCSITEVVDNFESGSRPDDILLGPLHDQTTLILKMRSDIGPYLESQIVPVEVSWTKLIAEVHKKPSQKTLEEFLSAHEKETKNYWGACSCFLSEARKFKSNTAVVTKKLIQREQLKVHQSRPTTVRATTGYLTLKGYLDAISVETIGCLEQMTKEAEFFVKRAALKRKEVGLERKIEDDDDEDKDKTDSRVDASDPDEKSEGQNPSNDGADKQPNDDRDAEGAREDQQSDGGDDGSNSVADSDSEKSGKSDGSSGDSDSEDRQASDSSVDILESPTMVRRTSLLDDELHIIENDEDESDDESDAGRRAEYERQKMEEQADSQGNAHMNHKDAESGDKTKENGDKESELVNNPSFTGNEVSGDLDHHGSVKPTNSIGITSIGEYQTLRNAAMRNDDNFCRDPLFYPIDVVDKFIASYQEGLKDLARTSKPQKESDSCHVKATTKTTEVDGNSENNGGGSGDKENKIDDEESEHLKPGDDEADEKMDLKDHGNSESDDIESDGDRESELSKGPASSSVRIEQDTKESDKHGWQKPENTMGINSLEHYKILMEAAMKGNKNYHRDPLFYPIHVVDSCIESYQDGLKDKVRTSELQKEAKTQKLIQSKAQGQVVKRLYDYGLSSDSEKTSMNLHPGTSGLRKKIKAKKKRASPPSSSSDSSPELDNRQKKATTKTKEDTTSATKNKTAWKKPKKSQKHKSKSARWSTPRSTRPPRPASRLPLPDEVSCRRSCCCGPTGRYWKHLPAIDPY